MPNCIYCQQEFVPSKYRWSVQKVCTGPECRKKRQRESLRVWREKNPYYYKIKREDPSWHRLSCQRARTWRHRNSNRIRSYRENHIDQYRTYMRLYMRRYRQMKKDATAAAEAKGKA